MIEFNEARVEEIARNYCRLLDLDPDERVAHGADVAPGCVAPAILLYSPRWKRVAIEVRERLTWNAAEWEPSQLPAERND